MCPLSTRGGEEGGGGHVCSVAAALFFFLAFLPSPCRPAPRRRGATRCGGGDGGAGGGGGGAVWGSRESTGDLGAGGVLLARGLHEVVFLHQRLDALLGHAPLLFVLEKRPDPLDAELGVLRLHLLRRAPSG